MDTVVAINPSAIDIPQRVIADIGIDSWPDAVQRTRIPRSHAPQAFLLFSPIRNPLFLKTLMGVFSAQGTTVSSSQSMGILLDGCP